MATSVYKFVSWDEATGGGHGFAGYYGTIQVHWDYNRSGKTITITGITYNDDRWWCVGAAMRLTVNWSDGTSTDLANGTYNWNGSGLITNVRAAGFVTKNGVLGVFSDGNRSVTHTFSGTTGGFGISFGSTASTINYGNPASYRALPMISGTNPSVTFIIPPTFDTSQIWTRNDGVYMLSSGISGGINWGTGTSGYQITAVVSYTIDGNNVSYTAFSSTTRQNSYEFSINAQSDNIPWNRVPDDETVTVKWTIRTVDGAAAGQKTQYCQKSYTAYVIEEGVNGGQPVEADLMVSNAVGQTPTKGIRRIGWIDGGSS